MIQPIECAIGAASFRLLQEQLERLGVSPSLILIGLEATSRYGEKLYRFLEQHGYYLCLLHPRQTHQFAQQRSLCAIGMVRCTTIARVLLSGEARQGMS